MEKHSKSLLLISGLLLILVGVPRLLLNTWLPYSEYVFYLSIFIFICGLAANYKTVLAFSTMRTTKYGLNMGSVILLGLLLYICVNFFAFRYDKSVDITSDKLNSLSLQSLEVLKNLKDEVTFKVYYQGANHSSQNMGLKILFKKYQRQSSKLKTSFVDAHKDPTASTVLNRTDKGKLVVFAVRGAKTERVKEPVSEESLTSALFRLEQTLVQKIYFLSGHGERPISKSGTSGEGAYFLRLALEDKGFEVASLNLSDSKALPEDMSLLVVVGPKKELLESEANAIQNYISKGGRLFLALDPTFSNLTYSNLAASVGIGFEKETLLSTQKLAGGDSLSVLGREFNKLHPVTSVLDENAITVFYQSGGLEKIGDKFEVTNLVSTLPVIIPVKSLENYQVEVQGKKPVSKSVSMISEGRFDDKEMGFKVAAAADSDFLSDVYFETGFNKDLALNLLAHLAGQEQLISIRPRAAKNTKLILTSSNAAFVLIIPILIPLVLLIFAVVLWFRRRGA